MNAKDILKKLKAEFAKMQISFSEAKLQDGTVIKYDGDLMAGVAIMVTGTDGNDAPIADGEYMLEDGTKLTIVGGLVTEVSMQDMGSDFASSIKPYEERMAKMEAAINQLVELATKSDEAFEAAQKELTETKAENEKFKAEFKSQGDVNKTILEGLEKISKAAAGDSTDKNKKQFKADKSAIELEVENMAAMLNSRKS